MGSELLIPFKSVMLPLSAALGASVGVERILEVAKSIFEPLMGRQGARKVGETSGADQQVSDLRYMYRVTEAAREIDADPGRRSEIMASTDTDMKRHVDAAGEWEEQLPCSKILVQEATDADDGTVQRAFIMQLLGVIAGIVLARIFDIQLFHAFKLFREATSNAGWDYLLTGLLIGGGSAPVHVLINFISERKIPVEVEEVEAQEKITEQVPSVAAPAVITRPSAGDDWVDIPYSGGVDREILENIHRRQNDPDLIVVHHTAMSSRSTFEDVVRVIKSRTDSRGNRWLTGYNSVILADGSMNTLCRWDRYGSHAVGYNQRSLGITFNGNFETDPKVPFSNPTGKYGPSRPTEEQLRAGARLITLWTFLYPKIRVDFKDSIIPHKQISAKTCPGGMFPYDDLQKWVEFYRGKWEKSTEVQERIALFRQKPYLYVRKEA